jgi:hypothetical protein
MIDWQRPATVQVDGRAVFTGTLSPDLLLTLTESARRFDLDRLRWAGLRVRESGGAAVVTATTPFQPLVPGS